MECLAKEEEYDVLVIGGGATGCGIALDAVSRGACNVTYFSCMVIGRRCKETFANGNSI